VYLDPKGELVANRARVGCCLDPAFHAGDPHASRAVAPAFRKPDQNMFLRKDLKIAIEEHQPAQLQADVARLALASRRYARNVALQEIKGASL